VDGGGKLQRVLWQPLHLPCPDNVLENFRQPYRE
jgi:hypothetical protein